MFDNRKNNMRHFEEITIFSYIHDESRIGFISTQSSVKNSNLNMLKFSQLCDPARQELAGHLRLLV